MQLEILRAIQSISNPLLDAVMEGITLFGEAAIIMAFFCAVYWCFDKRMGRFLAISLGLSLCVNGALKDFFKVERPFGAEGIISHRLETATGYSFPSGHTQTASAFWGGISVYVKRPRFRVIFAALVLLVGFSRLYLGVHYPADVLGGIIVGVTCILPVYFSVSPRFKGTAVLTVFSIAVVAALIIGESPDTYKGAGAFAGIISGFYFEDKFVGFETSGLSVVKRLVRYALSMFVAALCYGIPKLLLPESNPADFMRYAFLTFAVMGLCPFIFNRLNI